MVQCYPFQIPQGRAARFLPPAGPGVHGINQYFLPDPKRQIPEFIPLPDKDKILFFYFIRPSLPVVDLALYVHHGHFITVPAMPAGRYVRPKPCHRFSITIRNAFKFWPFPAEEVDLL